MVITGGAGTKNTVSVYSEQGWQKDLPGLTHGRYLHTCTSYMSGGKRVSSLNMKIDLNLLKMFIVFGGSTESDVTNSAEIFDPNLGSWRAGTDLPRWMRLNCAINIDNRVLIFGWYHEHIYDEKIF